MPTTNPTTTAHEHRMFYAACPECGADDCRYDDIDETCPTGHAWTIESVPVDCETVCCPEAA